MSGGECDELWIKAALGPMRLIQSRWRLRALPAASERYRLRAEIQSAVG